MNIYLFIYEKLEVFKWEIKVLQRFNIIIKNNENICKR